MPLNRLNFSTPINAASQKIWKVLWDDQSYRDWASIFEEGTYRLAPDWEAGSRVHFLSSNQAGIFSEIIEHVPNQLITFKHLGTVEDGIEQPETAESKIWIGARESYHLSQEEEGHLLTIDIDVMDEHLEFMTSRLPMALKRIKELAEL